MTRAFRFPAAAMAALLILPLGCRRAPKPVFPFEDVAAEAGIAFRHMPRLRSSELPEDTGSGACFADVDGDGDLDVYLVDMDWGDALFRNNGDGTFAGITKSAGLAGSSGGMGCLFGDADNDGDQDLLVTRLGANIFYRNDGGKFTDVTDAAGLGHPGWGMGAAFADYDLDGDLDLYLPNYVTYTLAEGSRTVLTDRDGNRIPLALNPHSFEPEANVLYRNDGGLKFADVTELAGVADPAGRGMQALFTDFDRDGYPDLYVANDVSANAVFRNKGDGTFENAGRSSWAADRRSGMGLAAGDFDNDGDQDFAVTNWLEQMHGLYLNLAEQGDLDGSGFRMRFSDAGDPAGVGEPGLAVVSWGVGLHDFDNDGFLDLFVANGSTLQRADDETLLVGQGNTLFRNNGDGTFIDVTIETGPGFDPEENSRGAAFADYDDDGDIDILINNMNGPARLLRNNWAGKNRWLKVRLRGVRGNRDSVGAALALTLHDGRTLHRVITAGDSYLSDSGRVAHFGLGSEGRVKKLVIRWPGGAERTVEDVPVNRTIDVKEPS